MKSKKNTRTYVVTGGAGFIGSHLVKYLVHKKHKVKVLDNFSNGSIKNLDNIKNKIEIINGTILDTEKLFATFENVDGIFHQAALISVTESEKQKKEYHKVNVIGTENIFEIAKRLGIKVVFASSASIYGQVRKIPITERQTRNPIGIYAQTKSDCEKLALRYVKDNTRIVGLRYFNVYGKNQSSNGGGVISNFLEKISSKKQITIFGNGLQTRDFVNVLDVVKVNLLAMESKNTHSIFYNIGSGKSISILNLAKLISKISRFRVKIMHNQKMDTGIKLSESDISLAKKELRWNPQITLENWIKKELTN